MVGAAADRAARRGTRHAGLGDARPGRALPRNPGEGTGAGGFDRPLGHTSRASERGNLGDGSNVAGANGPQEVPNGGTTGSAQAGDPHMPVPSPAPPPAPPTPPAMSTPVLDDESWVAPAGGALLGRRIELRLDVHGNVIGPEDRTTPIAERRVVYLQPNSSVRHGGSGYIRPRTAAALTWGVRTVGQRLHIRYPRSFRSGASWLGPVEWAWRDHMQHQLAGIHNERAAAERDARLVGDVAELQRLTDRAARADAAAADHERAAKAMRQESDSVLRRAHMPPQRREPGRRPQASWEKEASQAAAAQQEQLAAAAQARAEAAQARARAAEIASRIGRVAPEDIQGAWARHERRAAAGALDEASGEVDAARGALAAAERAGDTTGIEAARTNVEAKREQADAARDRDMRAGQRVARLPRAQAMPTTAFRHASPATRRAVTRASALVRWWQHNGAPAQATQRIAELLDAAVRTGDSRVAAQVLADLQGMLRASQKSERRGARAIGGVAERYGLGWSEQTRQELLGTLHSLRNAPPPSSWPRSWRRAAGPGWTAPVRRAATAATGMAGTVLFGGGIAVLATGPAAALVGGAVAAVVGYGFARSVWHSQWIRGPPAWVRWTLTLVVGATPAELLLGGMHIAGTAPTTVVVAGAGAALVAVAVAATVLRRVVEDRVAAPFRLARGVTGMWQGMRARGLAGRLDAAATRLGAATRVRWNLAQVVEGRQLERDARDLRTELETVRGGGPIPAAEFARLVERARTAVRGIDGLLRASAPARAGRWFAPARIAGAVRAVGRRLGGGWTTALAALRRPGLGLRLRVEHRLYPSWFQVFLEGIPVIGPSLAAKLDQLLHLKLRRQPRADGEPRGLKHRLVRAKGKFATLIWNRAAVAGVPVVWHTSVREAPIGVWHGFHLWWGLKLTVSNMGQLTVLDQQRNNGKVVLLKRVIGGFILGRVGFSLKVEGIGRIEFFVLHFDVPGKELTRAAPTPKLVGLRLFHRVRNWFAAHDWNPITWRPFTFTSQTQYGVGIGPSNLELPNYGEYRASGQKLELRLRGKTYTFNLVTDPGRRLGQAMAWLVRGVLGTLPGRLASRRVAALAAARHRGLGRLTDELAAQQAELARVEGQLAGIADAHAGSPVPSASIVMLGGVLVPVPDPVTALAREEARLVARRDVLVRAIATNRKRIVKAATGWVGAARKRLEAESWLNWPDLKRYEGSRLRARLSLLAGDLPALGRGTPLPADEFRQLLVRVESALAELEALLASAPANGPPGHAIALDPRTGGWVELSGELLGHVRGVLAELLVEGRVAAAGRRAVRAASPGGLWRDAGMSLELADGLNARLAQRLAAHGLPPVVLVYVVDPATGSVVADRALFRQRIRRLPEDVRREMEAHEHLHVRQPGRTEAQVWERHGPARAALAPLVDGSGSALPALVARPAAATGAAAQAVLAHRRAAAIARGMAAQGEAAGLLAERLDAAAGRLGDASRLRWAAQQLVEGDRLARTVPGLRAELESVRAGGALPAAAFDRLVTRTEAALAAIDRLAAPPAAAAPATARGLRRLLPGSWLASRRGTALEKASDRPERLPVEHRFYPTWLQALIEDVAPQAGAFLTQLLHLKFRSQPRADGEPRGLLHRVRRAWTKFWNLLYNRAAVGGVPTEIVKRVAQFHLPFRIHGLPISIGFKASASNEGQATVLDQAELRRRPRWRRRSSAGSSSGGSGSA